MRLIEKKSTNLCTAMPSHSNLQIFQLGTKERNESCVIRVIQNVSTGTELNDAILMTPFVSVKEWRTYQEKVTEIKSGISDARNLLNAGIITDKAYKSRMSCYWYPKAKQFMIEWGTEMVPFDVRWTVNNVEDTILEMEQTQWPSHVLYREKSDIK